MSAAAAEAVGASAPAKTGRGRRPGEALNLEMRVDRETAAALCDCSARWIAKLSTDGYIPKPVGGAYVLRDVVHGVLRQAKDDRRGSTKTASASRVQDARAEEIKIRTDERTQRLLREAQSEAIDVLTEFAGGLRADLQAIPARFTADLSQRAKLAQDIDTAFGTAARRAGAAAKLVADARRRLDATGGHPPKAVGGGKSNVSRKRGRARAKKS